jgi:hypothetical protein
MTPGFDNEKIWDKAARLCMYFDLTPEEAVGAIAEDCNARNIVMMQHYLVGMKAEKIYREVSKAKQLNAVDDVGEYIKTSVRFFIKLIAGKEPSDIEYILKSPSNSIEPWIRIIMGRDLSNFDEIKELWLDAAKRQIKNIKGLNEAIKSTYNISLDNLSDD